MEIKSTKHFLTRLEDLMSESEYVLRYEKGNFQSGYCVIRASKVAIVNKYYSLDGKINSLIEIIRAISIDPLSLSEKNQKLLKQLQQKEIEL